MHYLFKNNFYYQFKAPNADDLIEKLNKETEVDNSQFSWGQNCNVDRIPLTWEEYTDLMTPSINMFMEELRSENAVREGDIQLDVLDPWINIYTRGCYQELHDHWEDDLVCVFFLNTGENFSKFYFRERNNTEFSDRWRSIMDLPDNWYPTIEAGDMIFFPGHMFHGVTCHHSDEVRKTFSCNFKFVA